MNRFIIGNFGASRSVLAVAIFLLLSSCQKTEIVNYVEQKKTADTALENFHKNYNRQSFNQIYEEAAPVLREKVKFEEFIAGFKEVFSRYGRVVETSEVATACFPLEVRTVRHTKYERGDGGEMIIWSIESGRTSLASYQFVDGKPAAPTESHRGCEGTSAIFVPSR